LIKILLPTIALFIIGCELYDNSELNPRDLDSNYTPGLVFDPSTNSTSIGAAAEFDVFVVAAENISGIHAQIAGRRFLKHVSERIAAGVLGIRA